ncbi:MAG TPA: hypothetical protein VKU41_13510 [Polyangiaceae bacterium]|nr:hypothetical protein [Polyangiaceae bacterium]
MRVSESAHGKLLGYVHVQVGSRVYALPVEARRLVSDDGIAQESGFIANGSKQLEIVVDSEAPEAVVRETIERASAQAVRHIARKVLN